MPRLVMLVADDRIDRRVLDQGRTLTAAGWEVTVIALTPLNPDNNDEKLYPELEIVRINIEKAPRALEPEYVSHLQSSAEALPPFGWALTWRFFPHALTEAINRPADVYTGHDLPMLPPALLAARIHKAALVYDSHELYPYQAGFSLPHHNHLKKIESWLVPYVDHTITVNESIAKHMHEHLDIPKPQVILNCPAINSTTLPIDGGKILHQSLGIPLHKKILLYQGGLVATVRNLEKMIEAFSLIQTTDLALVLMGPDGAGGEKILKDLADRLGLLHDRVFFHSAVSQDSLLQYTASADVGIIPYPHCDLNTYYCTPNKLFEFTVAGLPILANDSPELNSFVSQQRIGMNLPMNSAGAIAHAIDAFFSCNIDAFRSRVAHIAKRYTWEEEGKKIIPTYNSFVENNYSPLSNTVELCDAEVLIRRGAYAAAAQKLAPLTQGSTPD